MQDSPRHRFAAPRRAAAAPVPTALLAAAALLAAWPAAPAMGGLELVPAGAADWVRALPGAGSPLAAQGPAAQASAAQAPAAQAAPFAPLPPGVSYDPSIPTPREVIGHDPGERITPPEDIVRYFEALAEAAPERTHLVHYAETWQGRPLVLLAIGSEARMAGLDEVRAGLARLADPRGLSSEEEERLIAGLPVVSALVHSVHGNEITPAASSMVTAYHLLAARGDADVERVLAESVVLIDPVQNPDGRARFVAENLLGGAAVADADPVAAERDHPWPGSRSNHYLFDLNRDWFAHTQPESRGRVRALLEWNPHVVVDLHEMGSDRTYYFPPAAVPGNPHTTATQAELFEVFGRENARLFDERGWPYFIREIYDSFYPGYGASWPTAHGALGKTFEQASPRGLVVERYDGSLLSYPQGVEQNFSAAFRTLLTAAENRERMLAGFLEFRRSAVEEGRSGTRAYVLPTGRDPALTLRLAATLAANGVEVRRSDDRFEAGGRSFEEGGYVVPMDQPAHRLVRNLLDPDTEMDSAFVERQRERRARRLRDEIYDVTAWNLPHLWNVEAVAVEQPVPGIEDWIRVGPDDAVHWARPQVARTARLSALPGGAAGSIGSSRAASDRSSLPDARVGWLLPWSTAAAQVTAAALDEEIPLHAAGASFVLDGRRFGVGTVHVRAARLSQEQQERLAELAERHGAEVVGVDDAFVEEGISLGSSQMRALPGGDVLLVWDTPASTLSAGWARWVLERRYGKRVTAVRASSLGRADLSRFGVVVLPSGSYAGAIGGGTLDRLSQWVRDGGTLVTMAESTRWAAREDVGFLSTQAELRAGSERPAPAAAPDPGALPIDPIEAVTPRRESPEPISGAILRAVLDTTDVLSAGSGGEMGVMVSGSRIFTPLTLNQGTNVATYAPLERLVMSGIVWEEARPQVASKAFLMHESMGRGRVIAFAEDPNFRGYAEGTQLLFMNAVLLGPAF